MEEEVHDYRDEVSRRQVETAELADIADQQEYEDRHEEKEEILADILFMLL